MILLMVSATIPPMMADSNSDMSSTSSNPAPPADDDDDRPPIVRLPELKSLGIYTDYSQDVAWFYDTFFTVVFEVEIPTWNATDLRMQLSKNLSGASELVSCNDLKNDTDHWASTLCPTTRKFFEILDDFAKELEIFENLNASSTKMDSYIDNCHDIKPHFSNHIIDEVEMDLYMLEVIMNCPMTDVLHKGVNITRPNRNKYADILQLFVDTYISPKFRIMGYSKYAIATNTLLGLHTTQLLDYFIDTFQWATAQSTCRTQRVPRIFISTELMLKTLQEVQKRVKEKGFKLTVPTQDLSNYYKLKLADCVMTMGKTFIVRMLVPLTKTTVDYQLMEIRLAPFLDQVGESLKNDQLMCRRRVDEGTFIVDAKTKAPIAATTCDPAELCRVPPDGDRKLFNLCTHAALVNDTAILLKHCPLTCMRVEPSEFPFIRRVSGDQFVIAGSSSADIAIKCKSMERPLIILDPPKYGSLLVSLPCGCLLTHRSAVLDIDHGSCSRKTDITHLVPFGISDTALSKFYHHAVQSITDRLANFSEKAVIQDDDGAEAAEVIEVHEDTHWPVYIAYVLLVFIGSSLGCAIFVIRNLYIRVGQLEVNTALVETRATNILERAQFHRDSPVTYNARASNGNNGHGHNGHSNSGYVIDETVF